MRLTLRTLLSWKDGMLEPDAAGDLAARVEASPDARGLMARIDEVVARPTLSAPAPEASGFAAAANTAAEYLDNVLPGERLGEFERVCFTSEAQLAETAATHDILASLSRSPTRPLDAAASRRLLAAARARSAADDLQGSAAAEPARSPRRQRVKPTAAAPRRATRPPTTAWLLVAAALLLLVTLVGVLGWSLTKAGRARAVARDAVARKAAAAPTATKRAASPAPPAVAPPAAPVVESAVAPPAAPAAPEVREPTPPPVAVATALPVAAAPEPVSMSDDVEQSATEPAIAAPPSTVPLPVGPGPAVAPGPPAATVEQRVPQGDALAIAAPAVSQPPVAAPPPDATVPATAPAALVSGRDIVLLRSANDPAEAWLAGAEATPLDLPVDLVAPPFCRPTLVVDDARIALEPGTCASLTHDAAGRPWLEVVFGGAVITEPGRLGLRAGGLSGSLATGPAAAVGVEVMLQRPSGAAADATQRVARLVPTAGRIVWQPAAGGDALEIVSGQALEWRSESVGQPGVVAAGPPAAGLTGSRDPADLERRAAAALSRGLPAGSAAVPVLRELAAHRRVENRVAAAAALALVGDFDDLARLLVADGAGALPESLWNRLDAVAVQPTLARGARAADAFAAAVAAHAPAGAADAVIRFARGPSDDDLAAGMAAELVAALESQHLVVRRYAIRNLVEMVGTPPVDRLRYRADRSPEELRDGAAWWRTQLEQGRVRRAAAEGAADR